MKKKVFYLCLGLSVAPHSAGAIHQAPRGGSPRPAVLLPGALRQNLARISAVPQPTVFWTSDEFTREAVRTHRESTIHEHAQTVNSAKEVGRFLRDMLTPRGQRETLLPKVAARQPQEALPILEGHLQSLFDGGVKRSGIERDGVSLAWEREHGKHFGYLTMTESGGLKARFTVYAPGGSDPRITNFAISMAQEKVHFKLDSTVSLSQDIARKEPVKLRVSASPDIDKFVTQLAAKLSRTSRLMAGQAERAARRVLRLIAP